LTNEEGVADPQKTNKSDKTHDQEFLRAFAFTPASQENNDYIPAAYRRIIL
jgi:hypothetical protein